jgi:stage III sporulation protein AG
MVNQLIEKNEKNQTQKNDSLSLRARSFYEKIKSVKHFKVIAAALLLAVAVLVFAALYQGAKSPVAAASDPLRELETRLADLLSDLKGAGKVNVMIMYDGGMEIVTAESKSVTTNKTTDTSGGVDRITENTTETSTPIIINEGGQSKPIILKEIMPNILGVVIVAEGADSISVRMELLKAAAKILDVDPSLIEIFTMKK